MFMLSSTTKGITATCMHLLVEKHKLNYDMPIVKVWPEFGQNGKSDATLRHALSHQTGVPQTPVGYTPDWLPDWDRMCRGIAALKPMYPIGQRTAYHSLNYGHINGEILRRIDGRTIAQFLQDEICKPLGINGVYLGVPDRELHRVAVLTDAPARACRIRRADGRRAGGLVRGQGIQSARGPAGVHPRLRRHHERARPGAPLCDARQLGRARRRARPARSAHSRWYRASELRVGRDLLGARAARARVSARPRHRTAGFRRKPSATSAAAARSAMPIRQDDSASDSRRTTSPTRPAAP